MYTFIPQFASHYKSTLPIPNMYTRTQNNPHTNKGKVQARRKWSVARERLCLDAEAKLTQTDTQTHTHTDANTPINIHTHTCTHLA